MSSLIEISMSKWSGLIHAMDLPKVLLTCLLLLPSLTVAVAQSTDSAATTLSASSTASPERIAKLEQQVTEAKSSADNAWMLVSAALVLMMTGPGLALFYGGLVRKKNVLGYHDAELRA